MIKNSIKILHHLRQKAIRPSHSWHAMQFLPNFLMGDGALFLMSQNIKGICLKDNIPFPGIGGEREREREWVREIRDSAGSEILLLM